MKKTRSTKRILCALLAIFMVLTSCPLTSFAAPTEWTQVASSDFTNSSWTQSDTSSSTYRYTSTLATTEDDDIAMSWTAGHYYSHCDVSVSSGGYGDDAYNGDSDGYKICDGWMFLSGTNGTETTPITGADAFKIEVDFSYFSSNSQGSSKTTYPFILIGNQTFGTKASGKMGSDTGYYFAQDLYGNYWVTGSSYGNYGGTYKLDTSSILSVGEIYTYCVSYSNGWLRAWVEDSNGTRLWEVGGLEVDIDTSQISYIAFGDDNNSDFLKYCNYKEIRMYTGETQTNEAVDNTEKTYYLFTYFTGNDEEGETVKMAISDDGYNYEALNGNQQILSAEIVEDNYNVLGESSSTNGTGIADSGHVRDPYVFQAEDGSYYCVATDLDTESSSNFSNNSKLIIWHGDTLLEMSQSDPWNIDITDWFNYYEEEGSSDWYIQRAWAPQAIWDPEVGSYMLYFGVGYVTHNGKTGRTISYYCYTDDFLHITEPQVLLDTAADLIDCDITYDEATNLYWLYCKDESSSTISFCSAESPSGPYSDVHTFTDGSIAYEGVEIAYNNNDGNYMLFIDNYSSTSVFSIYTSTTIDGFNGTLAGKSNISTGGNINHLSPRHGSITAITKAEAKEMIAAYGKGTFDISVLETNQSANDYLVGRFFTNSDLTYDAVSGQSGVVTISGAESSVQTYDNSLSSIDGENIATAYFNGGTSSSYTSSAYAYVSASDIFDEINIKDGVTLSWYGYSASATTGRWFDWTDSSTIGSIVWNGTINQSNTTYAFCAANTEFGGGHNSYFSCDAYKSSYTGWHEYTMIITENYMTLYVDGTLLSKKYTVGNSSSAFSVGTDGSPYYSDVIDQDYFDTLLNGNIYFSASSYGTDTMLTGYIYDFRVYDKALAIQDVSSSVAELQSATPGVSYDGSDAEYYDPMEDDADLNKSAYDNTVTDDVYGDVLSLTDGGTTSQYTYYGSNTDASNGYTISMWYNTGDSVDSGTIICLTNEGDFSWSGKEYLTLLENGYLYFNYQLEGGSESYIDMSGVFGDDGLEANSTYYITIQIVPNGDYDLVYVYVDGVLTFSCDTYTTSLNKSLLVGQSIHEFMAINHKVLYGYPACYWSAVTGDEWLDDVVIYNEVYTAKSLYSNACVSLADTLYQLAIPAYEEAMAKLADADYVYTNLLEAYEAYDAFVRYCDACDYGEANYTPSHIVELYLALVDAVEAMEEYVTPATIEGLSSDDTGLTNSVGEEYTQNMLTTVNMSTKYEFSSGTQNYLNCAIYSGSFVWLYDGINTPTAPINVGVYRSGNTTLQANRRPNCVYTGTTDMINLGGLGYGNTSLGEYDLYWHISSSTAYTWYYNTSGLKNYGTPTYDTTSTVSGCYSFNSTTTWYIGSSYLRYVGGEQKDSDGSSLLYWSFDPEYYARNYNSTSTAYAISATGTIYVVNYAPVYELLTSSDLQEILSNITDYNPADVMELLSFVDDLTALDYTSVASTAASVSNLTAKMQTLMDAVSECLEGEFTKKADSTELANTYQTEVNVNSEAKQDESSLGYGVEIVDFVVDDDTTISGVYTTSSWALYEAAVENILLYFSSLNPFSEDSASYDEDNDTYAQNASYATDPDTIQEMIDNVQLAKDNLCEVADYTPVTEVKSGTSSDYSELDTLDGTTDGIADYTTKETDDGDSASTLKYVSADDGQVWTFSSQKTYTDAYDYAVELANTSTDEKGDTAKYLVTYMQSGGDMDPFVAVDANGNVVSYSVAVNSSTGELNSGYTLLFIGTSVYTDATCTTRDYTGASNYALINGVVVDITGYRFTISSISVSDYSTAQETINQARVDTDEAYDDLAEVDIDAAYETYDYAIMVAELVDTDKYTDEAVTALEAMIATLYGVDYSDDYEAGASAYVNYDGATYKDTAYGETDSLTASLLSLIETLNSNLAQYVKNFTGLFTVQTEDGSFSDTEVLTAYYGEEFTFDVASVAGSNYDAENDSIIWSVTHRDGTSSDYSNGSFTTDALSSKKLAIQTDCYEKIADSNIEISATIVSGDEEQSSKTTLYIYDVYGNVCEVQYVDTVSASGSTLTIDGSTYTNAVIPFYSLSEWTLTEEDGAYHAVPVYIVGEYYTITVYSDGENASSSEREYDAECCISYTGSDEFVAWAVDASDGYQIVSYNEIYRFWVACEETYVPITTDGDSYYVNGDVLTADDVENSIPVGYEDSETILGMTADEYLYYKLDSKMPFVSVQKAVIEGNGTKARIYARVTTGCEVDVDEIVVVLTYGSTNLKTKISSVLDSGQYLATLTSSKGFSNTVSFATYITYNATYTVDSSYGDDGEVGTATISMKDMTSYYDAQA